MQRFLLTLCLSLALLTGAHAATYTWTPAPTELWHNNAAAQTFQSGYWTSSCFASAVCRTSATKVTVTYYSTLAAVSYYPLGVRVNDVDVASIYSNANTSGLLTASCVLPPGNAKKVEIVSSAQDATSAGGAPNGNYIVSVVYDEQYTIIPPPDRGPRILVEGDSVAAGGNAGNDAAASGNGGQRSLKGWVTLLRQQPQFAAGQVAFEGYGYHSLKDDAGTTQKQWQMAYRINAYGPSTVVMALMSNDWLNQWSAANYGTALASVLDKVHQLNPAIQFVCVSSAVSVAPNNRESGTFGFDLMSAYRAQMAAVCAARPTWTKYIDGLTVISTADLSADGIHCGTAGNITYMRSMVTALQVGGSLLPTPSVLVTANNINAFTVANTALYTVPTGKTCVVTGYNVRVTAASGVTAGPTAGVGNASGTNNIAASQAMNGLTSTATTGSTSEFSWPIVGMTAVTPAGGVIYFNLGTAATGGSMTISVDTIGYLQ